MFFEPKFYNLQFTISNFKFRPCRTKEVVVMKKSFGLTVLVLMLVFNLTACGSKGGGGGGGASYSVGGTISGLTGTVVLQNNGADDLTITADGAFTFATKVADGGAYSATVLTQPETQTCTASSNTGTIAGADVTDVSVVCSINAYTVGGTVSGLSGTIVLQNNGADNLTITTNSTFTFSTEVADTSPYSVTILSDPVLQNCSVSNGSGTMSGSNVTNVSVTCANKSWTHPASLTDNISPDGQDAKYPQAAMDDNGNVIIVWAQSDGSFNQIFKSEYRNGAWTHPASLADNISPDGQGAFYPQVAMDNNGNAVIAWHQSDGTKEQIFKSEYRNGAWTHPASLADNISPDGQHAESPQVAMDNNGNAVIVWYQVDNVGTNWQIFKSEYRNGAWTHPASLTDNISPDGQTAYSSQVAMDNNGNAVIVWYQVDNGGTNWQIFKSEYRNNAWTHPADLADNISPDGQNASGPQVAMDNNGNAVIVWCQSDGSFNNQIFKSEYRNNAWTHPSSLTDNISPDGQYASSPQVAMDNNGNAVIVWQQNDGANGQIFKSEYRSGAWTHPADLTDNISPDEDAGAPEAAMDDNGNAVIVWDQYIDTDNINIHIFKSEYRNGAWTHPASLTDNISPDPGQEDASSPQAAMDNNGNAVIVWQQNDGTSATTYNQIFKSEFR